MSIKKYTFPLLLTILLALFVLSVYEAFIRYTDTNYSHTQNYTSYFSVEDWNLTKHAIVDIDDDGKKDMITFTNCVFLSGISPKSIPTHRRCIEPGMSIIAFPDYSVTVGQKLISDNSFNYNWLSKSYLVQTQDHTWKFYELNGLQIRTFELGEDHLFAETHPTVKDRIDAWTYQIENIGVTALLFFFSLMYKLSA